MEAQVRFECGSFHDISIYFIQTQGGDYENHQNDKIACEESFSKTLFPPNTVTLHDPAYKSTETFGNNGEIDLKVLFLGKLLHFVNNAPYDEVCSLLLLIDIDIFIMVPLNFAAGAAKGHWQEKSSPHPDGAQLWCCFPRYI